MAVETYRLTGHYDSSPGVPGRGFVYVIPSQTVVDGATNVVVGGVKIRIDLDDDGDLCNADGDKWFDLPTGIGYTARPILYDGYPPEADFTVAPGTVTIDLADVTDDYIVPLDPTGLEVAQAYTDARVGLSATTAADLTAAITALATTGGTILLPESLTLSTGVTIPQGITVKGANLKRTVVTYTGTGSAFTFTGTSSTDSRIGGGIVNVTIKLAGVGGTGVLLTDARHMLVDVNVLGNNATGTTINAGSVGVKLRYASSGVGCSWNNVRVYAEYCGTALLLDGTAFTPTWVTRNEFYGFAQTCTIGVDMRGANSNKFEFHPQNCGTGWTLTNADGNDIYTYCENNTTDWTADNASINNRVRGTIGVSGTIDAANPGFNTRWQTTLFSQFSPMRGPVDLDGNGSNFILRPLAGQSGTTHHAEFWTRDNADALTRMLYFERGVAGPRTMVTGPAAFTAAVDFSSATVSGIPAPAYLSSVLAADVLLAQSSTTQQPTGLSLAVAADTTYDIQALIFYDSSTTADINFQWTYPSGAVMSWGVDGLRTAATTGTDTTTRSRFEIAATTGAAGGVAVGTVSYVMLVGTLVVGSTAGTLALTAAQNVSDPTQTTIKVRSRLRSIRMG